MKQQFSKNFRNACLTFKRWNRKGYSVFNTLHKVVKITSLNLAYSIVLLPTTVLSQTDTSITKTLDLDEVIVSAQKSPVIYSRLSRVVSTIDNEEIQLMPVAGINELLENFSGIDVRQRGTNGIQSDISIRGGSFDQNLILLNGVNISDPQTGHHSLNLPIDLNSVERIEILEGPGSRVFGPNAFSGAINIITNQSDTNYTKARFSAGDFGLFSGSISSSYKVGKTKHFFSVSKSKSDGFTGNTDFDQYNIFYNTAYNSEYGKVDFQIGYTNKAFGANSFYTPEYPDQFEQTKTTFTSLKFETGTKIKLIPVVYFRRHKDRFELFRYEPASWYTGHNYHLTDVYGAKIDARISSVIGVTSFGAELRSENIWSNVLGNLMNDTLNVVGEPNGFYSRKYSRTVSNYFLEHSYAIGRFAFSTGLLASWVSDNNFDFNVYPGIDLSYSLPRNVKFYATVNKSLRLPTFTDLFYSGPSNIGNPDLKPEEAWSYEVGVKFKNKKIRSDISFFTGDSKDLIAWVKPIGADASAKWETQNLTSVTTYGIEISNKIDINKLTIHSLSLNYSYLDQEAGSDGFETKYSLNYLKHNLVLDVNQRLDKKIGLSWIIRYQDRAGSYLKYDENIHDYVGEKAFEPFWIVDTKLTYQFKICTVYAEATNLFNANYVDVANVIMPGRWFKAGIELCLKY